MKVSMTATVPVAQYANLQPGIEFEVPDTMSTADALQAALAEIKGVWDRVGKEPLKVREGAIPAGVTVTAEPLVCWASGVEVPFDPVAHKYGDGDWLSGSKFAGQFSPEFNAERVAGRMADKHGVEPGPILDMWELNGNASSSVGTAVHAALELRGKYGPVSASVKDGDPNASALSKNPILRPIVEQFYAGREDEVAAYEAFVADPVLKHCGQIDRLLKVGAADELRVRVQDWKTNADLHKYRTIREPFKGVVPSTILGGYWLQLSFYARILKSLGWTVEGLDIFHWDGAEWVAYEHKVIDITEAI